ncbi:uncharacterized protein I206_104109 [Kwoniella pini CBS 10737]|uniref:Polysaccharide lyase 14 domain-containing protein n=1 Tax=Kwoniella pini CBS 10737 TaxID=1296096 RepID=A0A1B9I2M9_9TREE|nr:uncharacterized protein I206_04315 [Kwoniella pini CBS 10737]OCF49789.1 hypothetical protein I206_04315 [Kwoniella pini CBS 10737]
MSSNMKTFTTLSILLTHLISAAPLPSETTTSTLPTLFVPYPAITDFATTSAISNILTGTPSISLSPTASGLSETDWSALSTVSPIQNDNQPNDPSMVPVLIEAGNTSNDNYSMSSTSSWTLSPNFSDMSSFKVSTYAAGKSNIAILKESPIKSNPNSNQDEGGRNFKSDEWDQNKNSLQILYPKGSINPGNKPQGGSEFFASPIDLTKSLNASLEYSVYFPNDFDFVKGGKLPGLYGGHKGCSGGNAAEDCFSTRLMWRAGGQGELYLYVPKDKQTPELCQTPPKSICESAYGLSIGRGAWTFAKGDWTTVRQDVWLNTPGQNDGGFNIWVNGQLVMSASDVRYRENGDSCIQGENGDDTSSTMINTIDFGQGEDITNSNSTMNYVDEDWQVSEEAITSTSTSIIGTVTVTSTLPPIGAYATSYSISSNTDISMTSSTSSMFSSVTSSASSSQISSSTSKLQRRDDQASISTSSGDDTTVSEHALVITIPITDSITTVTASPTTEFITVPTTLIATSTITNAVTITPLAITDTVYVTENNTQLPATITVTASISGLAPSVDPSYKAILIEQSSESPPEQSALMQFSGDRPQQPIILKSPPGQIVKSPEDLQNNVQAQSGCGVGFIGLFFSTFFGGHTQDWASPKDQYTYFKDFKMWINQ